MSHVDDSGLSMICWLLFIRRSKDWWERCKHWMRGVRSFLPTGSRPCRITLSNDWASVDDTMLGANGVLIRVFERRFKVDLTRVNMWPMCRGGHLHDRHGSKVNWNRCDGITGYSLQRRKTADCWKPVVLTLGFEATKDESWMVLGMAFLRGRAKYSVSREYCGKNNKTWNTLDLPLT